jgi:hypothetical protein
VLTDSTWRSFSVPHRSQYFSSRDFFWRLLGVASPCHLQMVFTLCEISGVHCTLPASRWLTTTAGIFASIRRPGGATVSDFEPSSRASLKRASNPSQLRQSPSSFWEPSTGLVSVTMTCLR